jgi:TPR repeat protein
MEQKIQSLKELYEKDFYLWVQENLKSIKTKAQERENIQTAWELAVYRLINWFKEPQNHDLAKKYFSRLPTEKDFPQECPYTFEQVMEY